VFYTTLATITLPQSDPKHQNSVDKTTLLVTVHSAPKILYPTRTIIEVKSILCDTIRSRSKSDKQALTRIGLPLCEIGKQAHRLISAFVACPLETPAI
jgi:hypothetical protein